ncbi:transglutaminase domain-containing protein [bacterium]|nr:transglutaminase domain-containing protein [bacterium]
MSKIVKIIISVLLCILTIAISAGSAWYYEYQNQTIPLKDRVMSLELDLRYARDSMAKYRENNRLLVEENKWYHLVIPSESGIFYPAEISHQYYIYGQQKGKYLELSFNANKYFEHRRRKQESGLQRFIDASTPHENFLYTILDSLRIVPNDSARNDANAQKILNFVNSIPYEDKKKYYVKMPIETLVEGRGHCADLAILMHSLMITAGLDALLVFPTDRDSLDHTMVGVNGDFNFDRTRTYFFYPDSNGKKYYLCQPTGTDDMRYPILHKVGFSHRYPYSIIFQDSVTIVENKKEWLKRRK